MAMNFPSSPTVGQTYSVSGGPTYTWDGSVWKVLTPGQQYSPQVFTATAGQTTFTISGGYVIGAIDVFRNGVKLVSGSDYTATDLATVVLVNACSAGDTVEAITLSQILYSQSLKNSNNLSDVSNAATALANLGGVSNTSQLAGNRNKIINGAMMIDQRNAGVAVTQTTSSVYTVDRWFCYGTAASKFTVQQNAGSVTPPAGFINYLGVTSSSAYAVGSADALGVIQCVEGLNVADLGWGTANAASVTISFWVRSSLTGTFGGALQNGGSTRSYAFNYSISSANTWEQKSVTIPGDASGTWLKTNGIGIQLIFTMGAGSSFSGTANTWASSNLWQPTGATSVVGTNGATFYITGVQLEKGATATPFENRLYGTELALCQRYGYPLSGGLSGFCNGTTAIDCGFSFPVQMRTAPSATAGNLYAASYGGYGNINQASFGVSFPNYISQSGGTIRFSAFSSLTSGAAATIVPYNITSATSSYYAFLSAEL